VPVLNGSEEARTRTEATARLEAAGPVLQSYVRKVPVTAPFFDAKRDDPVVRFVEDAPKHPVFKLIAASDVP